jgi:hypothetical protein
VPVEAQAFIEYQLRRRGGMRGLDGWRERTKLRARAWWLRGALQRNLDVFADPLLRPILDRDSDHGARVLRPFLIRDLDAAGRAQAVADHYGFFRTRLSIAALNAVYLEGKVLAQRETPAGLLALILYAPTGLGREGELRMALELDGRTLHMFAMAVVMPERLGLSAGAAPVLWIGCNKGPGSEADIPDLIKRATKAMQGMRPKALMLHGAQALVRGWGLAGLYGVANAGTVFAGNRYLKGRIKADYDQFWQEYEARVATSYVFELPLEPVAKDLATVASNKRAAAARKAETARHWFDDITQVATQMRVESA